MITLTADQVRALAEKAESPRRVVDPETQHIYYLVSCEVYTRAQALVEEERDVQDMYPHLAELDPEDWQESSKQ